MAKPKTPGAKSGEATARYYRNKQPPKTERWTHVQFQQWVKDMDYPPPIWDRELDDPEDPVARRRKYWREASRRSRAKRKDDQPEAEGDDKSQSFPYDARIIARHLGTTTDRVYAYWRGYDKGTPLLLTATMTLLCKLRLRLKQLGEVDE